MSCSSRDTYVGQPCCMGTFLKIKFLSDYKNIFSVKTEETEMHREEN